MVGFLLGSFIILDKAAIFSSDIDRFDALEESLTLCCLCLERTPEVDLDDSDSGPEGGVGAKIG